MVFARSAIGEFPWLPENTSGSGPQFSGPAWILANEIATRLGVKLVIARGGRMADGLLLSCRAAGYAEWGSGWLGSPCSLRFRLDGCSA